MLSHLPFTTRQLDLFASLCRTRSFGRTAEIFGITQAAVSSQIRALEHQLGINLFERRAGKRPILTRTGMNFFADMEPFVTAAQSLARHRQKVIDNSSGTAHLRILVGHGLMDNFIRPSLDRFCINYPHIELIFDSKPPNDKAIREIRDGVYDFALIHGRVSKLVEPWMTRLAEVRGGIYGHRDFADTGKPPLSPEIIEKLPFIMPTSASSPEPDMVSYIEGHGLRLQNIVGHIQYYDIIAEMLEQKIGVSSFADPLIPPRMRDSIILLLPLENWNLLWHRKDGTDNEYCNIVQKFLWSCVLYNDAYLKIDPLDPE